MAETLYARVKLLSALHNYVLVEAMYRTDNDYVDTETCNEVGLI